jgi:hypothetical protein
MRTRNLILLVLLILALAYAGAAVTGEPKSDVAAPQSLEKDFDIARFARVVTWDPNRTGSHPSRIEELKIDEIFLETDVLPAADGTYVVPRAPNGQGCIGLQWMQSIESRILKELVLLFAEGSPMPSTNEIRVEWWVGESAWQGDWKPLPVKIEQEGNRWFFRVVWPNSGTGCIGVEKVRWIFPASTRSFIVRKIEAFTLCQWGTVALNLELEKPKTGRLGKIDVYNGEIIEPLAKGSPLHCEWNLADPLQLKIRYCKPEQRLLKSDRTLVTVRLPEGVFSVSINDVLEHGCVYVPAFGFFVAKDSADVSLDKYRQEITGRKTIRQQVRQMPDQSFTQAMSHGGRPTAEKVHHKVQDNGPTMLSLACDNHKFVVERAGDIWLWHGLPAREDTAKMAVPQGSFKLIPTFGSGKNEKLTRNMYGGWLPVPVITVEEGGIRYRQRTFVAPYGQENPDYHPFLQRQPICVAELTVENPLPDSMNASLKLRFLADAGKNQPAELQQVQQGAVVQKQDQLLAFVDTSEIKTLKVEMQNGNLILSGAIPAQTKERCFVYIPTWEIKPDEYESLKGGPNLLSETETYWNNILASAAQLEIPEPLLLNVIRSSQVYCLMAARNEEQGKRFAAWISSDRYGPLESEAHSIIRGMDLMGNEDFARRSLDFFINKYNPAGYLTTGYTVMGTGWHLWTLAEHYQLTKDSQWLKKVAPEVARVCQWIVRQREKTKKINFYGEKLPEYGLMPPGVAADWNRFGYRSYNQGNFYAGLDGAARCLADIGYPDANSLLDNAAQFREDIQHAYQWTQQHSPVLSLSNGTWVPYYPSFVYGFGEDAYPGEDGGRSWCYDVEIGSHHLAVLGVLDETDPNIDWIADRMEDVWFFHDGLYDYPAEETKKDWFNLGGFSKVQPYYTRIQELYALIDDVKPFIRSYFNAIPSLLNTENLSFWEHFHNNGAWNKTHETGWFLAQTRMVLVMEHGDDELWLAPFVTNHWMKDGMVVGVRNAPTKFGKVSYKITSAVSKGYIEAVIEPPMVRQAHDSTELVEVHPERSRGTRSAPKALVLRLRHPDEKHIKSVTVNGKPHKDFDPQREYIRLKPNTGKIIVRAQY